MMGVSINLFIAILLFVGVIVLQVFLSGRKNKWLGLILPVIFILLSVVQVLNIMSAGNAQGTAAKVVEAALLYNIPTAILFIIYGIRREKKKTNKEIDKMNIKDLH